MNLRMLGFRFAVLRMILGCEMVQPARAEVNLVPDEPIALPGAAGHFDFMGVDTAHQRILAAHTGTRTLEIIDLKSGKPLPAVHVGDAQGVAMDARGRRYFLGNKDDKSVVTLSAKDFTKISETKVDGPVDAIAYDSKNGLVYAAKDDGDLIWAIDPKAGKIVETISIPGIPEVLEYDAKTNRIYLNIKDKDLVVKINPETNKVEAKWATAPVTSPHGLAIDSATSRIFTAGRNGKLVSMDMKNGKVLSSVDIPAGVDQIAFDPNKKIIYSACKGAIGVSEDQINGLRSQGSLPSPKGAHTIAALNDVWVSYSDKDHSYLQRYRAASKRK